MKQLKANKRVWTFFEALPPGYKRLMIRRIMSAKKEETRQGRMREAIRKLERNEKLGLKCGGFFFNCC